MRNTCIKMSGLLDIWDKKKVQCISSYRETGSIIQTQRKYCSIYVETAPARNTILQWVQNYIDQRSVKNQLPLGDVRRRVSKNKRTANYFNGNSRRALQTAERNLAIPRSSIQGILKTRLSLFLYNIHIVQELEDRNCACCTLFANSYLQNTQSDSYFSNRILFSDECVFHVDGKADKQNIRIWRTENWQEHHRVEGDSEKYVFSAQCR